MNTSTLERRITKDLDRTWRDLSLLKDDAVSGVTSRIGKMAEKPRKSTMKAVHTLNKSIGHGLTEYNARVQKAADKVPGTFSKKIVGYPWVAVSMAILMGLFLGVAMKPGRRAMIHDSGFDAHI